jgi:hypothetical protein
MSSPYVFRFKAVVAALGAAIVCAVVSFFMLNSLNLNLVHGQLYSYGLEFSTQWAILYWQYLNASFATIGLTLIFAGIALSALVLAAKRNSNRAKKFCSAFSIITIITAVCSLFLYSLINGIVNGELYNYELKMNSIWFNTYQLYYTGFIGLQVAVMALSAASAAIASLSNKKPLKISAPKIVFPLFLAFGSVLIVFSLLYDFLAGFFGGFALVFWGSIMMFISGEHLVKKDVLDATSLTYVASLDKMANQVDLQNIVYTTPNSRNNAQNCPNPQITQIQTVELKLGKPEKVNLAPENELFNLLERTLGKSFSRIGFLEFKTVLPKLLVESLEIAQNVTIEANGDIVKVTLENPYDLDVYLKANNQNRMIDVIGCPLSGAIAYALANSSNKAVIINRHLIGQDKKSIQFEYTLLGQRSASA